MDFVMTTHKLKSGWLLFKQALAGDSEINYTEGSIARVTILLAIPMILEMAMESVFAIVDIFFVSGLGTDAVATVGLTEAVITLLYAVAIGLSMGATAMIARRIGEDDPQSASLAAGQAIRIGIFVSVVVGLIGLFFARNILLLMGAEESVVDSGENYTRLMFGASLSVVFLFLVNSIFRGAGDAVLAMRALWLANGINIVLDPCFIYGVGPFPELGVTGAAVATNIGRSIGVIYGLYHLFGSRGRIRMRLQDLGLQLHIVWSLIRISIGGVSQFLVATASWVFLMQIVSGFGSEAVAGMPDRAEITVWHIAKYNAIYMGAAALAMLAFTGPIVLFFTQDLEVISYAEQCLRIFAYGYVFWGFGMAIIQAFNGAGDTMTPTWINVLCFWVVQVPLAYVLALTLGVGPVGVFWAVFVADALSCIVGVAVFRRGKWKLRQV
jgi:Na+-driven multidrug efflux pump